MGNVSHIYGGPALASREPSNAAVETLREMLVMAEAGELQGFAIAYVCADSTASYRIAGRVSTFGVVGAAQIATNELAAIAAGE